MGVPEQFLFIRAYYQVETKAEGQGDSLTSKALSALRSFGLFPDTKIVLWSGNFAAMALWNGCIPKRETVSNRVERQGGR